MTTKFSTLFDTLTWDEVPLTLSTSSSALKITQVTSKRTYSAVPTGPTFSGTGVASYTLVYTHDDPTAPHEAKATHYGITLLEGTFFVDGKDGKGVDGSLVVSVDGFYDKGASAKFKVIEGTLKGEVAEKFVGGGEGAYEAKAMKECPCWFELKIKA